MKITKIIYQNENYYPNKYSNFAISNNKIIFCNSKEDTFEVNSLKCNIITDILEKLQEEHKELYEIVTHPDVITACEEAGLNIEFNNTRIANGKAYTVDNDNTVVHEIYEDDRGLGDFATGMILGGLLF